MKIDEILKLDCRIKENKKFLVTKFKSIPFIEENLENPNDIKELKDITRELVESAGYHYNTLTHHVHTFYTLAVYDDLHRAKTNNSEYKIHTLYALDKKEIYLKLCVFAYYSRKISKRIREGKTNEKD